MYKRSGKLMFSPSDLIRYLESPFASWMDRYYLENPEAVAPDQETGDQKLIAEAGNQHERAVLDELKSSIPNLAEIATDNADQARQETIAAVRARAPIIYQAALTRDEFAGYADFIILGDDNRYRIWDTKLARAPKPYYAIQLCCYSEMFAATTGEPMPESFGIILGSHDRVEFRLEDFRYYYLQIRDNFLALQRSFTGKLNDRPEPLPGADHGRWTSHAQRFFDERDHLVRVAGITSGQIKKLNAVGITTVADLETASDISVPKLAADTLEKLVAQARLQNQTNTDRRSNPAAPPRYEIISHSELTKASGLAALPLPHSADVFFDMEGYPLVPGGLEYLFGACTVSSESNQLEFYDWWAHDREEEKVALEGFVDWVYERWRSNPGMHIYHYAPYEVSAVRRLSTRHNTRQDEVDELLRHEVFVDLYQIVRQGLRIGEESYSIKKVERLYRPARTTEVATAAESIVQYAQWIESQQPRTWAESPILRNIRMYNEVDCRSTAELTMWLRTAAEKDGIIPSAENNRSAAPSEHQELSPEVVARLQVAAALQERGDVLSRTLADLIDFHRREEKPMWWRMFDRTTATPEELRDDPGCIEGIKWIGNPVPEKQSLIQTYEFDPSQECKLASGDSSKVMFSHNLDLKAGLAALDLVGGRLQLKVGKRTLSEKYGGTFPGTGSLLPDEYVSAKPLQVALTAVAEKHLAGALPASATALLTRKAPVEPLQELGEPTVEAAIRVAHAMDGDCLVIQGPPGTGKTYTASRVICDLVHSGKKVGVVSNSHKAVLNLVGACGEAISAAGGSLRGIKVGGTGDDSLFSSNPDFRHVKDASSAIDSYVEGVIGGTAWLFVRPEWEGKLDYLFIDEAGQVSLANVIAMSRATRNLVLLGDQMQLEQPIQGSHPGDSGLSSLQYALLDVEASRPDAPLFHSVVPSDYGLFLGESRRMHPAVCSFISESIYDGRLQSHEDCARQRIEIPAKRTEYVTKEYGIVFSGIEHEGNIQQSAEEVDRVVSIYDELLGRTYIASDGTRKVLTLSDFLFIAPYNAQVRALEAVLPKGARVGSVDKFQGQQAPVCILSLCSSYGEYGSRGLAFILDRNRINVALSRAQCLAVVTGDPRIATATARSLDEMRLINLFCKLSAQS